MNVLVLLIIDSISPLMNDWLFMPNLFSNNLPSLLWLHLLCRSKATFTYDNPWNDIERDVFNKFGYNSRFYGNTTTHNIHIQCIIRMHIGELEWFYFSWPLGIIIAMRSSRMVKEYNLSIFVYAYCKCSQLRSSWNGWHMGLHVTP